MNSKRRLNKILIYAKKIKAINILGGKCKSCGESDMIKLCFHHTDMSDKEFEISKIKYNRWSLWEKEIKKCELLCNNCHVEFHLNNEITYRKLNKSIFLEYKKMFHCEICGYDKCQQALQFHHLNDKSFEMRGIQKKFKKLSDVDSNILLEIDKCSVICNNCHVSIHSDTLFFHNNKDEIMKRVHNLRENSRKIDKSNVISMYKDGLSVKEIMDEIGCKKSAIYDILSKMKKNLPL